MRTNSLIHSVMEANADRQPDQKAFLFLDEAITHGDLAQKAASLASVLFEFGLKRGQPVGIYMTKSIRTPVAIYGILKAGSPYVPLDPAAPVERLSAIIENCGIEILITSDKNKRRLGVLAENVKLRATIGLSAELASTPNIAWREALGFPRGLQNVPRVLADDLSYIIYTSGSTGTPKGMMHTHRSCLSFADWACREYGFNENDILSNHAPLHFDLSILDYFSAVCAGSTTAIIPEEYTKLPASYSELIEKQKITVLYTVPYALIQLSIRGLLDQRDLSAVRWAIFGGEPMALKYLRKLMEQLPNTKFDNIYGPAEVNGITHHTVSELEPDANSIPIGPLADIADGLIVDDRDCPVPEGEPGELLVRTPTMMQGYVGRPDLNEKAFYSREALAGYKQTYYRTGDIVRQDNERNLWFLGRKDRQVKVRGYRIELDEIEAALLGTVGTEEVCAFVGSNAQNEAEIHAAATLREGAEIGAEELKQTGKKTLPPYAVPEKIFILDEFPRTSTGKIDRRLVASQLSD